MIVRHLQIDNTIWLNPSRKLLGMHKWFFCKFEDMPKSVFAEFKHHSHTHSSVVVTSSSSYGSHEYGGLASKICGPPNTTKSHLHIILISEGDDAHTHSITVTFAAANLGSPNWWEHVHALTGTPTGSGGAAHTHTLTSPSEGGKCTYTGCTTIHAHTFSYNIVSRGASHTHAFSGNSAYSTSGQTALSHTHTFSFTTGAGDDHSHPQTITSSNNATCKVGVSHAHYLANATDTVSHNHTGSGTSGSGGEAVGIASKRLLVGVGL